jgi:hypothetical protein
MYVRKTVDEWQIWTNYGYGWENETTELTFREAREQVKCYRANVPGIAIRIRFARVKKETN